MGANMARRLHDCGYKITAVYDTYRAAALALAAELHCLAAPTLAATTAAADLIFTVVSDDAAMRQIFLTRGDSLLTRARGKLFINCATITPALHVAIERAARRAGAATLEACMASSITQARDGTLYLMLGGQPPAIKRALPVLRELSASLRPIGPAGSAAQIKALVNMVMNANTAALAEGLGLAAALGHDLTLVREVFAQTGANSRVLATDGADMQNRDHATFFSAAHAAKDSAIALALAKTKKLRLPLAAATLAQYRRLEKLHLGHLDKSALAELTFPGRSGFALNQPAVSLSKPSKSSSPKKLKPLAKNPPR
jgi:3-hydroxyisobutyrate dehydrogenase-like beta-hydroxyacid dehydrogenase